MMIQKEISLIASKIQLEFVTNFTNKEKLLITCFKYFTLNDKDTIDVNDISVDLIIDISNGNSDGIFTHITNPLLKGISLAIGNEFSCFCYYIFQELAEDDYLKTSLLLNSDKKYLSELKEDCPGCFGYEYFNKQAKKLDLLLVDYVVKKLNSDKQFAGDLMINLINHKF